MSLGVNGQTSGELATDGAKDLSLDFGLYPFLVSVGDFVWLDENRDGVFNGDEVGLGEVTVTRGLHADTDPELWQSGQDYQTRLVTALRAGDAEGARAVLAAHMQTAHRLMKRQEAALAKRFLPERGGR